MWSWATKRWQTVRRSMSRRLTDGTIRVVRFICNGTHDFYGILFSRTIASLLSFKHTQSTPHTLNHFTLNPDSVLQPSGAYCNLTSFKQAWTSFERRMYLSFKVDGFDVMAVTIDYVRGVVALSILRSVPWGTVVCSSCFPIMALSASVLGFGSLGLTMRQHGTHRQLRRSFSLYSFGHDIGDTTSLTRFTYSFYHLP